MYTTAVNKVKLYRGLKSTHHDFKVGERGEVHPPKIFQGDLGDKRCWDELFDLAQEHNLSTKDSSPFTSWSKNKQVAENFSGGDGIVLEAELGNQIQYCF